jgi:threonine/homoserine/homoserine lactone efflux protein
VDIFFTTNVLLAYSIYILGVASPGPSNLAIMATAMGRGRKQALVLSLGIMLGSLFWGALAAFGLSSLLANYSYFLSVMKALAALYLLFLAYKSLRSAINSRTQSITDSANTDIADDNYVRMFFSGLLLHLTNPKAIFVWLSIVAFAMQGNAHSQTAFAVVIGCGVIGLGVFLAYAMLFSTPVAQRYYVKLRVWFEGVLAIFFGCAALRMLTTDINLKEI